MSTSEPTDADWATIPPRFWLAMKRVSRERDADEQARAGLQRDYDSLCTELLQTHAQNAKHTELETRLSNARTSVTSLEQQLLEARKEKENIVLSAKSTLAVALEEQTNRMQAEADGRERELSARLERSEASVREATQKLMRETQSADENRRRLEAERDDARAGRDKALARRNELEGTVRDRTIEVDTLRAELDAKRGATTRIRDEPSRTKPGSPDEDSSTNPVLRAPNKEATVCQYFCHVFLS